MENQMEKKMENEMETDFIGDSIGFRVSGIIAYGYLKGVYRGYIGIMEKKMEATI